MGEEEGRGRKGGEGREGKEGRGRRGGEEGEGAGMRLAMYF